MMSTADDTSPPSLLSDSSIVRRKHPCVLCQQRKVKCDRNDPCLNCKKARVECVSSSTQPPKRRKKRFPEAELLARIRKYEAHLRNYGADIDAINREDAPPLVAGNVVVEKNEASELPEPRTEMQQLEEGYRSMSVRQSLKGVENNFGTQTCEEFRDAAGVIQEAADMLQVSEDEDEALDDPITKTYDSIPSDSGGLLFLTSPTVPLGPLHPPPVQIFRLWQVFLDNVNPVLKLFHAPTVQQQVLEASADPGSAGKSMQVLMFGIYSMAVNSLVDDQCKTMFGEEKDVLMDRYQHGCRQALLQSGFLRSSDMTVLQGYTLYLCSCRTQAETAQLKSSSLNFTVDPRALFCLSGIAIRIAQRMGLNFDGTAYGLPPFETEMRRRLWWQIVFLDSRVGELAGCPPSMFEHLRTTSIPLNVNDSDLFPGMREPPLEHTGNTEMILVLPRCEIVRLFMKVKLTNVVTERFRLPDSVLDDFERRIEEKYLNFCDPNIPLHVLARLSTRSALLKVRLGNTRFHNIISGLRPSTLTECDKEKMFMYSLLMVEDFHTMSSTPSLEKFHWYIFKNFPFPARVYLMSALRTKTTGELAERAWRQLELDFAHRSHKGNLRHWQNQKKSALQMSIYNLTVKAWSAREADIPGLQPTPLIIEMRSEIAKEKERVRMERGENVVGEPSPQEPIDGLGGVNSQFGDGYGWITQPSGVATGNEPGFAGMGSMGNQTMGGIDLDMSNGQEMGWGMWDDFMQPGIVGGDQRQVGQGEGERPWNF